MLEHFYRKAIVPYEKRTIHYYFKIKIIYFPPNQETKCLDDVIQHSSTDFSEALPILHQL